jgi:hypothetical protein
VQALCSLVIERAVKIFTAITLFLEEQKKRDKQRKLDSKRRKELKAKQKELSKKEGEGEPLAQPGAPAKGDAGAGEPQASSLVEQAEQPTGAADALMNAESSSDNDVHGEGSQSQ